jgi:uracil-DNA glycosylase
MHREDILPAAWAEAIPGLQAHHDAIVAALREEQDVRPHRGLWYAALNLVTPSDARVVILGQDPYHGEDRGIQQAHGLAFSVPEGVRPPPSLRNILKELESDLGRPAHLAGGNLTSWARQGVLLLNASLTTRGGVAGAHTRLWNGFTDALISYLGQRPQPLVFILWGGHAQKHRSRIASQHEVLLSAHPSPLSAYHGFFGSRPFSRTNLCLQRWDQAEIDW